MIEFLATTIRWTSVQKLLTVEFDLILLFAF